MVSKGYNINSKIIFYFKVKIENTTNILSIVAIVGLLYISAAAKVL